jgi:hypothetical protein
MGQSVLSEARADHYKLMNRRKTVEKQSGLDAG